MLTTCTKCGTRFYYGITATNEPIVNIQAITIAHQFNYITNATSMSIHFEYKYSIIFPQKLLTERMVYDNIIK